MWASIIGIAGTLAGTIIGWVLNNLSNKGELKIYVKSFDEKYEYNQEGIMTDSPSKELTQYYSYNLSLDIYNSSGEIKIMREVTIEFLQDDIVLFTSIPYDDRTKRSSALGNTYDLISPINIVPKTVIAVDLHNGEWDDNKNFIWETNLIRLNYIDEIGATKNIVLSREGHEKPFND